MKLSQFSTNLAISEMVEARWIYAARHLTSIESYPLSNRVTLIAIVPGAYPGESKMWKKTLIHFTRTVENRSLATDISLYLRNG